MGDTGSITTVTGRVRVQDTTAVVEGLTRHLGYLVEGSVEAGQEVGSRQAKERGSDGRFEVA